MSYHNFDVLPQTPTRLVHSQSSLEDILSFTAQSSIPSTEQLQEAVLLYHLIIDQCQEDSNILEPPVADHGDTNDFDEEWIDDSVPVHQLFRALYDHCPTLPGKNNIVRMVLICLFATPSITHFPVPDSRSLTVILPRARQFVTGPATLRSPVHDSLRLIAAELLASFFIPFKAQGHNTPSTTSLISRTSPRFAAASHQGTRTRLRSLRNNILARDGNSCVATGILDDQYVARTNRRRRSAPPLPGGLKTEAAHIIPHSLNATNRATGTLDASKHTVWRVMNMFDPGISTSLEGADIDTPSNAMLLVSDLHQRFGRLECYFEEVGIESYSVEVLEPLPEFMKVKEVVNFMNHEPEGTRKSPLPSRRLLKFHRACCVILHMSGAAGYVRKVLDGADRDEERGVLREDGGSNLGLLLRARGLCEMGDMWESDKWEGRAMVAAN